MNFSCIISVTVKVVIECLSNVRTLTFPLMTTSINRRHICSFALVEAFVEELCCW